MPKLVLHSTQNKKHKLTHDLRTLERASSIELRQSKINKNETHTSVCPSLPLGATKNKEQKKSGSKEKTPTKNYCSPMYGDERTT